MPTPLYPPVACPRCGRRIDHRTLYATSDGGRKLPPHPVPDNSAQCPGSGLLVTRDGQPALAPQVDAAQTGRAWHALISLAAGEDPTTGPAADLIQLLTTDPDAVAAALRALADSRSA